MLPPCSVVIRFAALALLLVSTGCASTQTIERSDPLALAQMTIDLRGQNVTIDLGTKRARGRFFNAAADSTRWFDADTMRAAATANVQSVTVNPRKQNVLRGAIIGGVVFGTMGVLGCAQLDDPPGECYALLGLSGAAGGALLFAGYSALGSQRLVYRLTE